MAKTETETRMIRRRGRRCARRRSPATSRGGGRDASTSTSTTTKTTIRSRSPSPDSIAVAVAVTTRPRPFSRRPCVRASRSSRRKAARPASRGRCIATCLGFPQTRRSSSSRGASDSRSTLRTASSSSSRNRIRVRRTVNPQTISSIRTTTRTIPCVACRSSRRTSRDASRMTSPGRGTPRAREERWARRHPLRNARRFLSPSAAAARHIRSYIACFSWLAACVSERWTSR
mmetsp:Transcript_14783/g.62372  ORF Transcript_14783/g.62372 Transcript_14783/m.62372 type:complete len:231 (+) Transcript_14783:227-919(+)